MRYGMESYLIKDDLIERESIPIHGKVPSGSKNPRLQQELEHQTETTGLNLFIQFPLRKLLLVLELSIEDHELKRYVTHEIFLF